MENFGFYACGRGLLIKIKKMLRPSASIQAFQKKTGIGKFFFLWVFKKIREKEGGGHAQIGTERNSQRETGRIPRKDNRTKGRPIYLPRLRERDGRE